MLVKPIKEVNLSCKCGTFLLKSYEEDGTVKLRAKVLVFKSTGEVTAVCRRCGHLTDLPMKLEKSFGDDITNFGLKFVKPTDTRLYIDKNAETPNKVRSWRDALLLTKSAIRSGK